jgi:hypothetical protein
MRYSQPQERGFVRIFTAAIVTVGLVVSLSACASSGAPSGTCDPIAKSGDASSLITATGDSGSALDVQFPTPLITEGLEVSTVAEGDGKTIYPGQIADFHISAINATTGEAVDVGVEPADVIRRTAGDTSATSGQFGRILECATVGSRIAATLTVGDAFGAGSGGDQEGLGEDDTIVLVLDVVTSYIGRADGVDQLAQNGMPALALAPNGQPGITIPHSDAPKTSRSATTKLGDGATVKEGDVVVMHYTGIEWDADAPFDSSWTSAVPVSFTATSNDTGTGAGVVPGLADALIGAKVGSQFIAVVAPKDGFADDATLPTGVTAGSTLVYVVDVLGIQNLDE